MFTGGSGGEKASAHWIHDMNGLDSMITLSIINRPFIRWRKIVKVYQFSSVLCVRRTFVVHRAEKSGNFRWAWFINDVLENKLKIFNKTFFLRIYNQKKFIRKKTSLYDSSQKKICKVWKLLIHSYLSVYKTTLRIHCTILPFIKIQKRTLIIAGSVEVDECTWKCAWKAIKWTLKRMNDGRSDADMKSERNNSIMKPQHTRESSP